MKRLLWAFAFVCLLVPLTARAQNTLSLTVTSSAEATIVTSIAASEVRVRQASGTPVAFYVTDSAATPSRLRVEAGQTYSFFGASGTGYLSGATVGSLRLVVGSPAAFEVRQLPQVSSLSQPGTFTNTQQNEYFRSTLNSCDPSTEFHFIQSQYATEAMSACASAPAGTTALGVFGLGAYVTTNQSSSGGTVADTIGVYAQCRSLASGGGCWGVNGGASDGWPGTGVASRLEGGEFDIWVANAGTTGFGVQVTGNMTAQPAFNAGNAGAMPAFMVSAPSGGKFTAGFACTGGATDNGASRGNCLDIGQFSAGNFSLSQAINFHTTNGAGAAINGALVQQSNNANNPELIFVGQSIRTQRFAAVGTAYSGADSAIALGAGWGSTGAKSAATGSDGSFGFTITPSGTGIAANPTFTVTFKDGAWGVAGSATAPGADCSMDPTGTGTIALVGVHTTSTTLVGTYIGTPSTGLTYLFNCNVTGR